MNPRDVILLVLSFVAGMFVANCFVLLFVFYLGTPRAKKFFTLVYWVTAVLMIALFVTWCILAKGGL